MTWDEVRELFSLTEPEGEVLGIEGYAEVWTILRSVAFELADRLPECEATWAAVDHLDQAVEHALMALDPDAPVFPVRVSSNPVPVDGSHGQFR